MLTVGLICFAILMPNIVLAIRKGIAKLRA